MSFLLFNKNMKYANIWMNNLNLKYSLVWSHPARLKRSKAKRSIVGFPGWSWAPASFSIAHLAAPSGQQAFLYPSLFSYLTSVGCLSLAISICCQSLSGQGPHLYLPEVCSSRPLENLSLNLLAVDQLLDQSINQPHPASNKACKDKVAISKAFGIFTFIMPAYRIFIWILILLLRPTRGLLGPNQRLTCD